MKIRALEKKDLEKLSVIYERHYKDKFPHPDFVDGFIGCYVVTDDEDNIISGGGIRPIAECVILTDKDFTVKTRREALLEIMDISAYVAKKHNFDSIHAFVQNDEDWVRTLKGKNFIEISGTGLIAYI